MRDTHYRLLRYRTAALAGAALLILTACSSDKPAAQGTAATNGQASTGARESYIAAAGAILDSLVQASTAASDVLARANLNSESWKQESTNAFAAFTPIESRVAQLRPPPGLEPVQEQLAEAARLYREGAALLSKGISALDFDSVDQGAGLIAQGVTAIARASTALRSAS